eukprot:9387222-Heterocapsa_arctica.AAC.1
MCKIQPPPFSNFPNLIVLYPSRTVFFSRAVLPLMPSVHPISVTPESCALVSMFSPAFASDVMCKSTTLCFMLIVPSIPTVVFRLH